MIDEEEKYYIAGFLDRSLLVQLKGKIQSVVKKKKVNTGLSTDSKDFILRFQSLFGGNIQPSYKSSYSIRLSKRASVKLINEIGPYLKQKRGKVLEFIDHCKDAQTNKNSIAAPQVAFIDHENNPDYIAGLIDAGGTFGIFKHAKTQDGWFQKFEIMDDEKYLLNFLNSKNVKCTSHRKGLGNKRHYIGGSGNTVKPILETLLPLTKLHKDKFKIILDSFNVKDSEGSPNLKEYRNKLIEAKIFVIDKSILSTNLNSEGLKAKKQEKVKERAKERLRKRLEVQKEHRSLIFKRKEREQRSAVKPLESKFLSAKAIYEKEKAKLQNIKSDFKKCNGTGKLLHKDNFNVDTSTYDGLCASSRDYLNDRIKEVYRHSTKEYYREKFSNPLEKISQSIHTTVYTTLKKGTCSNSRYWGILGFTVQDLKCHLEKQFVEGMTWENYGGRWQVDHITPKSSFNLDTEDDLLECWRLENLQPLFEEDNLQKSAKILQTK